MKKIILLSYNGTGNIGDAIQTKAMEYLIEKIFHRDRYRYEFEYLDRDKMHSYNDCGGNLLIVNGWHKNIDEPFPKVRDPNYIIYAGIHASKELLQTIPKEITDIGCRDVWTIKQAHEIGLSQKTFCCGCVTSTLDAGIFSQDRKDLVADYGRSDFSYCDIAPDMSWRDQLAHAHCKIGELSQVRNCLTKRIHVALPAAAMGANVVFDFDAVEYEPERLTVFSGVLNKITGLEQIDGYVAAMLRQRYNFFFTKYHMSKIKNFLTINQPTCKVSEDSAIFEVQNKKPLIYGRTSF